MSAIVFGDAELEAALRDAGAWLRYPPAVDLVPAVRARITVGEKGAEASARVEGFWAGLWSPRFALVPALATAALLVLATLAFQPVAAQAADALGLRGLPIFRVAQTPSPAPSASPLIPGATRVSSVEAASVATGFRVLVPSALGPPDEVYVAVQGGSSEAFLIYRPRPGLPASGQTGIGALVTEVRGAVEPAIAGKLVGPGTTVERLSVDGAPAIWIEGAPHQFFYRTPSGDIVAGTLRLAGNVLAWDRGELLVRLEADLTKDDALRIASSLRQ